MTPHVTDNPYAELARQKKATKLADHLCAQVTITDAVIADLELVDQDWWNLLADSAGCNQPSTATIDLAISLIRQRISTAREPLPETGDLRPAPASKVADIPAQGPPAVDPFDGLDASPSPWSGLG